MASSRHHGAPPAFTAHRTRHRATYQRVLNGALFGVGLATLITSQNNIHLHIWLGILMLVTVIGHLVLHRPWIRAVIQRTGQRRTALVRAKAILDASMLVVFVLLNLTGGVVALIYAPTMHEWHRLFGMLFVLLVGVHLAMNYKWIVQQFRHQGGRRPARHTE